MCKRVWKIAVCAVAITLLATAAWAGNGNGNGKGNGTPDGETPANESVCEILKDATPGLYGLCIAFCEAQDCEPDLSLANPYEYCQPGSLKVLENYNKKKTADDPEMPCIQQGTCPCWTMDELVDYLQLPSQVDECTFRWTYDADWPIDKALRAIYSKVEYADSPSSFEYAWFQSYVPVNTPAELYRCTFSRVCVNAAGLCTPESRHFYISLDEYLLCNQQLEDIGRDFGFICWGE